MTNLPGNQPHYNLSRPDRVEYGDLVNGSFRIWWNHPILWVAGIITVLLQGNSSSPNFNYSFNSNQSFPTTKPGEPPMMPDFQGMIAGTIIEDIINNPAPYLMGFAIFFVAMILIQFIFGTWAQAALVRMTADIEAETATTLGRGWGEARRRLGALLGYKLLLFLPLLLIGAIVVVASVPLWIEMFQAIMLPPDQVEQAMAAINIESYGGLFCLIPAFLCLLFPYTIFITVIELFAFRSCLLAGTGPWQSIVRGWQLFRQQMGHTAITGVFYFILTAIVGVLLLLPILPFFIGRAGNVFDEGLTPDFLWSLVPIFLYMIVAGVLVTGIVRAYFAVLCTKLYQVAEDRLGNLTS